jgi:hypothetical protein
VIVSYIDAYKHEFGVEPICRVLRDHDLPIAPSTYYAFRRRPRSARSLSDERLLPIMQEPFDLFLNRRDTTHTGTEDHAAAERILLREVDPGILDRIDSGHHGQLAEAVDPLHFLRVDVLRGVPIVDIPTKVHFKLRRIENLNLVDAAFAGHEFIPKLIQLAAQRANDPKSGNDDATLHGVLREKARAISGILRFFQVGNRLPHGFNFIGRVFRNIDIEFLFKFHDQFHHIQRIGHQIIY